MNKCQNTLCLLKHQSQSANLYIHLWEIVYGTTGTCYKIQLCWLFSPKNNEGELRHMSRNGWLKDVIMLIDG